jgi:hypothetical protein
LQFRYQDYYTGNKIIAKPNAGQTLNGIYNDQIWGGSVDTLVGITSFRPLPTSGIVLFNGLEFTGDKYLPVTDDVPDLNAVAFLNITYSIAIISGVWELYDGANYSGNKWLVSVDGGRDGKGWFTQPSEWAGRNLIASLRRRK